MASAAATDVLLMDNNEVARQAMERTIPVILPLDESFDIEADTLFGVDERHYRVSSKLTAKLNKLIIVIDRPQLSPADVEKLTEGEATATDAK